MIAITAHCSQSWGKFWDVKSFSVVTVYPLDNSSGNLTQAAIKIEFSDAVLAASLTSNTADKLCSGSVQISVNDFYSCIRMPTLTLSSDAKTLTLGHVGIPNGQTAKVRLTTAVASTNGLSLSAQFTTAGFKTVDPPCGAAPCVTIGQAMGFALSLGAHAFRIESGSNEGKYLFVQGASTTTRIYDVFSGSFGPGPTLVATANNGSQTLSVSTGPLAGKMLHIPGGGSNTTYFFNPATNSFSTNTGSNAINNPNASAFSFLLPAGPNKGKYFIVDGNGTANSEIYDPMTNSFTANSAFANVVGAGGAAFYSETGLYAGSFYIICAGNTQNTVTYNVYTNGLGTGLATGSNIQGGSINFRVPSGSNVGKTIFTVSSGSPITRLHDPSTGVNGSGPTNANVFGSGSRVFFIEYGANFGKMFLVLGNGQTITNFYDNNTNVFTTTGTPTLPFTVGSVSDQSFIVEGGTYPGSILITGNTAADYTLYFP